MSNRNQFLTKQNVDILFNMIKKYIYDKTTYEIEEPEWNFLVNTMKRAYHPHIDIKELNKNTLDHVVPVIMKKISQHISQIKEHIPEQNENMNSRTLPEISENNDVSKNYEQLLESRQPEKNIPPPIVFTDVEPEYLPITQSPEDMMKDRELDKNIIIPSETDVIQSREFKTLQPEPPELQLFNEKKKLDLYFDDYIVVDSRDRNHDDYENSNNYRIDLKKDIQDVISIELISAEIPKSDYIINLNNNKIYFQETNLHVSNNTYLTATIPIGNYTISELKTEIENQMSLIGIANYTVTVDNKTKLINISSDMSGVNVFNLLFKGVDEIHGNNNNPRSTYRENSIGPVIGFSRIDKVGFSNYTGNSQYNLEGERYIMLHLRNIPIIDGISNGVQNAYHKITLNGNITRYYQHTDYQIIKKLNNPIKRLNELEISFRNYNNDLYDFHGLEHSLTFKITSIKPNIN